MQEEIEPVAALRFLAAMGADEGAADSPIPLYKHDVSFFEAAASGGEAVPLPDAAREAEHLCASCESVEALALAAAKFPLCPLSKYAGRAVAGGGSAAARLFVISEMPDGEEDSSGEAFRGQRGELMKRMLERAGLSLESDVFAMPAIPWRTPGEREPTDEEVSICRPFLARAIELSKPRAILAMGSLGIRVLSGRSDAASQMRGRMLDYNGVPLMPTFSLAYLLAEPAARKATWEDLQAIIPLC